MSFGSDPELLLVDDGKPRNALNHLPSEPMPLGEGSVFADNVLVEINMPPVNSGDDFVEVFRRMLSHVKTHIAPLSLVAQAATTFPDEEMSHPKSHRFGCRPELDAWTMQSVPTPRLRKGNNLRTCGGHIHVGTYAPDLASLARVMDLFVGVPAVLLNRDPSAVLRHQLYGGAGRFRTTNYGLEYRTLSNFWLNHPAMAQAIYLLASSAVYMEHAYVPADVIDVINNQDYDGALTIYETCVEANLTTATRRAIDRALHTTLRDLYTNWGV